MFGAHHRVDNLVADGHRFVAIQRAQLLIDLFFGPNMVLLATTVISNFSMIGQIFRTTIFMMKTIYFAVQSALSR